MPLPVETPTLDGKRLRLRKLTEEDTADMHALYADEVAMAYWGTPATSTIEESRQLVLRDIRAVDNGSALFWAIEWKATGTVIGKCTLWQYSENNQRAEVGYILNRQYWRLGPLVV